MTTYLFNPPAIPSLPIQGRDERFPINRLFFVGRNYHAHAVEMFGKTQVFRAGTIGTLAEKTAYGFVKKYVEENGIAAGNAEIDRLTAGCVGVRRTTGQHPGGLVVVPDDMDIEDFCPVQHPADDKDSEWVTSHFEYHSMEANILKLDMLGHDDPTMIRMMEDLKKNVRDTSDEDEVRAYLNRLLNKEEFDKKGLIYGMGHAVYSVSDPRAEVFKSFTKELADEKGRSGDFALYNTVERLGKEIISEKRKIYKGVSVNVDFYSGFVYSMLDIPVELFTPIFAIARITGWSAHRIEELINTDKIIRPAYKSVSKDNIYLPLSDR